LELTYEKVLKIFKTLPIGYYFGNRIEAVLSKDSDKSFINLLEPLIIISYPSILEAYSKANQDLELEVIIRTLLYHEVSHAILTPILTELDKFTSIIFNIFEDERIETLEKDFFLSVDFKGLLKTLEVSENSEPIRIFFNKVRLRHCSQDENNIIEALIYKYRNLDKSSPNSLSMDYIRDIKTLFKLFTSSEELTKEEEKILFNLFDNTVGEGESTSSEPLPVKLKRLTDFSDSKSFRIKLASILYRNAKIKGTSNSVMSKTSGKISPRLLLKPNNYKWFENSGEGSHFSEGKIKFNLYIDQSGSFVKNFNKVNSILKELLILEKTLPNFEFDLITMDNEITYKPKERRYIASNEKRFYGNSLNPELFKIYRKVQSNTSKNINIILFDGIATCDAYTTKEGITLKPHSKEQLDCFKAFNHANDIIISDKSNEANLRSRCRNAKITITSNFSEKLEEILLKKIQIFL
jgi:hypothetical protein